MSFAFLVPCLSSPCSHSSSACRIPPWFCRTRCIWFLLGVPSICGKKFSWHCQWQTCQVVDMWRWIFLALLLPGSDEVNSFERQLRVSSLESQTGKRHLAFFPLFREFGLVAAPSAKTTLSSFGAHAHEIH